MKKIVMTISMILVLVIATGCGCSKKEKEPVQINGPDVVENQDFEGLEFVNVGVKEKVIKTTIINNTNSVYNGSKFSMKIMDENGKLIKEIIDEVKEKVEVGSTLTIETKVDIDMTKATSIEYSIVK